MASAIGRQQSFQFLVDIATLPHMENRLLVRFGAQTGFALFSTLI